MSSTALRGVLVTCSLKFLNKFVEKLFSMQSPARFYWANATTEASGNGSREICSFDARVQSDHPASPMTIAISWIFSSRYLLLVLGGLMSSAWLGYARVLQIGGAIMLLATVLLSASVNLGLMCQPAPIILVTWLLLPLFTALIQPNAMYGIFRWHKHGRASTIVAALYLTLAAIGEWAELLMSYHPELGSRLTVIFLPASGIFVALTFLLPKESEEPFEMPTRQRMKKYFRIFSGLILFLIPAMNDTRPIIYLSAMRHYMNGTEYMNTHLWLSPDLLLFSTMTLSAALLTLLAWKSSRELPLQPRMQMGILLECGVTLGLMVFTLVGKQCHPAAAAIYSVASVCDGIAAALVLVTAFDLTNRIAPSSSKAIVISIMFTVLGLSYLATRLLELLLSNFAEGAHLAEEEYHRFLFIYHLIALLALILCSAYHKLVVFPLAKQLIPSPDSFAGDTADARTPLLTSTVA